MGTFVEIPVGFLHVLLANPAESTLLFNEVVYVVMVVIPIPFNRDVVDVREIDVLIDLIGAFVVLKDFANLFGDVCVSHCRSLLVTLYYTAIIVLSFTFGGKNLQINYFKNVRVVNNVFLFLKKGRLESTLPSACRRLEYTLLHHLCDSALFGLPLKPLCSMPLLLRWYHNHNVLVSLIYTAKSVPNCSDTERKEDI